MERGNRIQVIVGVFKGELGTIRVVDANEMFLITFDKPLNLDEIHFSKSEIRLYEQ
jgi:hypothetical protein